MENKTTGDLSHDLMSEANIDSYLHDNQPFFANQSVAELLAELYEKKDFSKAALARKAGMSEVYLHQVFAGRRNPSRDRLLCLCVGLETTLEEAQRLLKQAGYAPPLSPAEAGCHHQFRHRTSHGAGGDQRQAVCGK